MERPGDPLSVSEILGQGRYDDRDHEGYAKVQTKVFRTQLTFVAVAALAFVAFRAYGRPLLDFDSPVGVAFTVLVALTLASAFLAIALLPKKRFYVIDGGVLEYPRFGYTKRFGLSLREVDAYRREGRGRRIGIVLLSHGDRKLVIPEAELANPEEFARTLRFWKVRERESHIVRLGRH